MHHKPVALFAATIFSSALFGVCCTPWFLPAAFASKPNAVRKAPAGEITLKTQYTSLRIDATGAVTSLKARTTGREYSPAGHASPLLSLQKPDALLAPTEAKFARHGSGYEITLNYPGGITAHLTATEKRDYVRFKLISLVPREGIDNVVWGPVHTTISGRIGDLIGVVRSTDWAIGMVGLNDNTIGGPPAESDFFQMGYYIHSLDPIAHPAPSPYREGQRLGVGGDGKNDVAFFSHPEDYFQFVVGNAARVEPEFGSSVTYHSRDRRKPYTFFFSLLPDFPDSTPRHQITDPITDPIGADYIGSAVALYACPDDRGLATIESIILSEGLPHITRDGLWIRDPRAAKPDMAWYGQHDRLIEYADALGLKAVQDESLGEYYPNPADPWAGKKIGYSGGRSTTIREFTDEAGKHGILYGLHTLCTFIQPHSSDVHPFPNPHLQTVLRTHIASTISEADTEITVTDPSYLAEPGTWHGGPDGNVLRIGNELLTYRGISSSTVAPFTLTGVKRAQYGTLASPHAAFDELVKLQMNCYHGFVPDMKLLLDYADYYAKLLNDGGMQYIDFDGLESTLYQNQGYYAVRSFFRRLFNTYGKLSGGKYLRVMASATFPGGWEYESVGNVGGGTQNFDPVLNRWGIEGKDICTSYGNSYYPGTFGIQSLSSSWSVYDAENLQAKSIGWNATYMLGLSEESVERSGEKAAIFKQFRIWEDARAAGIFTPAIRLRLRDMSLKFHIEQHRPHAFTLYPVHEIRGTLSGTGPTAQASITNPEQVQPLQMALRFPSDQKAVEIRLPDGSTLRTARIEKGQFVIIKDDKAFIADANRNKISDLQLSAPPRLPTGTSTVTLSGADLTVASELTVWTLGVGF